MKAKGEFSVNLQPLDAHAPGLGRRTIDKQFQGHLQATSVGEMLSAMGGVPGSAGYVAMEQVSGSLNGKSGSFVLQHYGRMDRGNASLVLEVVPDSGTDKLKGLQGSVIINIENGKHFYEFDYEILSE